MDHTTRFLEAIQGQEIEDILSRPALGEEIHNIRSEFDSLPANMKEDVKLLVQNISKAIEMRIEDLKGELAQKTDNMQRIQKSADACIAYAKAPQGERK